MLGAAFYNSVLPANKLEYQLAPMYSFGSRNIAGMGRIAYHLFPYEGLFQEITTSIYAKQFAYKKSSDANFRKLKFEIDFRLRRKNSRYHIDNNIRLSATNTTDLNKIISNNSRSYNQFYKLQYEHRNRREINKYKTIFDIEYNDEFVKTSFEAKYQYNYIYKKTLDIRFFAGTFLYKSDETSAIYSFNLSGSAGTNDYTYDNFYFGRFENQAQTNILSNQFVQNAGGFSVYTPLGNTNEWIISANIATSLPLPEWAPVQMYANIAYVEGAEIITGYPDPDKFHFEVGAKLNIIKDAFEIYFPVLMSKSINDYSNDLTSNYMQKIRFTFVLNELNPFEIFRNQKNL